MDDELLDIFAHRLASDLPLMQSEFSKLTTDKKRSIPVLFRIFHNYKASSSYLNLSQLSLLVSQGENILNSLRQSQDNPSNEDVRWLSACISQLQRWCDQLLAEEPLSPLEHSLFPMITILDKGEKTAEIMQGLTLLYADKNTDRAKKMKAPLEHVFQSVQTVSSVSAIKGALIDKSCDVIILNMEDESISIAKELLLLKPDLALIVAVPGLKAQQKSRLLLSGLTHPIASPIQSSDLKRQLHNIVTSYFTKVHSLITHQKIYNFIQGIDPLPSSVKEITRLCDDPESSIKELIKTVESDPITSASMLHAASMPIYGVKSTSSIEQAVVSFGKRLIKALTLSDLAGNIGSLNLEAYAISEEQFKEASRMRLALMNTWYAYVNTQDLNVLCASAILGNLGEILINQELVSQGLEENFKACSQTGFSLAEVTILKTSSAFVTADILEFWGLQSDLIDSIRYSDSPFNASTKRIQRLACANAVVYQMVSSLGKLEEVIPESVLRMMSKADLQPNILEEAMAALRQASIAAESN
jgi:HD-like signal output (HDOD) protein